MSSMVVALSFSGNVDVLPFLWITSCLHIKWREIDNTKKTHTFSDSPVGTTYDIAMYTQSQTDEMDKFEYTIVLNSWVNLDQF